MIAAAPALAARDRVLLLAAIAGIAALAWAYLAMHAIVMGTMETKPREATQFGMIFLMWAVMMAAMMLPSVAPTLVVHAAVSSRLVPEERRGRDAAFASGYLLSWTVFSLAASGLQVWLERLALLSPALVHASPVLGGIVVAAAGVYQLTPAKEVCLRHCRSPLQFVAEKWRPGYIGAMRMGLWHGAYCIGCCGLLMALLFVGGVMNLLWAAAIAIFVLLEKLAVAGTRAGRVASGIGLIAAGMLLFFR